MATRCLHARNFRGHENYKSPMMCGVGSHPPSASNNRCRARGLAAAIGLTPHLPANMRRNTRCIDTSIVTKMGVSIQVGTVCMTKRLCRRLLITSARERVSGNRAQIHDLRNA